MKKNFLLMALTAVVLAMGFVSCSDDDDPPFVTCPAEEIAGNYTGGIYAAFGYIGTGFMPQANQVTNITYNEDGETVKVIFDNETWGTFTFESVTVSVTEDASFSLEGEGVCVVPLRGPDTTTGEVDETKTYDATFTGTITNGKLVAKFVAPGLMVGGTTIYFNFEDFDKYYDAANQAE